MGVQGDFVCTSTNHLNLESQLFSIQYFSQIISHRKWASWWRLVEDSAFMTCYGTSTLERRGLPCVRLWLWKAKKSETLFQPLEFGSLQLLDFRPFWLLIYFCCFSVCPDDDAEEDGVLASASAWVGKGRPVAVWKPCSNLMPKFLPMIQWYLIISNFIYTPVN